MKSKRAKQRKEDRELVKQMIQETTAHADYEDSEAAPNKRHLHLKKIEYKNEAQTEFASLIDTKDIVICSGPAGTGKSLISVYKAMELLKKFPEKYDKIVISKPAIEAEEKLGYLPGSVSDKTDEYIASIKALFHHVAEDGKITRMFERGQIKVQPLAYIRGITVSKAIYIVDELQNTSVGQLRTILSRIGEDAKLILNGDTTQIDTKYKREQTGLYVAMKELQNIPQIGIFQFTSNDIVRNPLISVILERLENYR